MARIIKYPANCFYCKKYCDPVEEKKLLKEGKIKHIAFLHRVNGKWFCHCGECYENKKELKK
jgi:hypothetical protein